MITNRRTRRALGAALAVTVGTLLTAGPAAATPAPSGPVVVTDKGAVRGQLTNGVREFQGIPYAAPPVGANRWGSPRPATAWRGLRDATSPGASCAQNAGLFGEKASVSER